MARYTRNYVKGGASTRTLSLTGVLLAISLAACGSPLHTASIGHTAATTTSQGLAILNGTVEIPGDCGSEVGYSDLHQGGQVVVKDATSVILGVATIGPPVPYGVYEVPAVPSSVLVPAQPATPSVVIEPAQKGTPGTIIPGDPSIGIPDVSIPGTPDQPAVTEPGTPAQPAITTPGIPAHSANLGCDFAFSVPSLPQRSFYQVQAGHRTPVTYSASELEAKNWTIVLTMAH
jgi:hypothetical protein